MPSCHKSLAWEFWQQTSTVLQNLVTDCGAISMTTHSELYENQTDAAMETHQGDVNQHLKDDKSNTCMTVQVPQVKTRTDSLGFSCNQRKEHINVELSSASMLNQTYKCDSAKGRLDKHNREMCTLSSSGSLPIEEFEFIEETNALATDHDDLFANAKQLETAEKQSRPIGACGKETALKKRKKNPGESEGDHEKGNSSQCRHQTNDSCASVKNVKPVIQPCQDFSIDMIDDNCDIVEHKSESTTIHNVLTGHAGENERSMESMETMVTEEVLEKQPKMSEDGDQSVQNPETTEKALASKHTICVKALTAGIAELEDVICQRRVKDDLDAEDTDDLSCVTQNTSSKQSVVPVSDSVLTSEVKSDVDNKAASRATRRWRIEDAEERDLLSRVTGGYRCTKCSKVLTTRQKAVLHVRRHTGSRPYVCDTCGQGFANLVNKARHMKLHNGDRPFTCSICDKSYIEERQLKKHVAQIHLEGPRETAKFQCLKCDKILRTKANLELHDRLCHLGERSFICGQCGKAYQTKSNLKRHERSHTGVKPWKCAVCEAVFTEKRSLERHSRTHTGEKPYQCEVCEHQFKTLWSYSQHKLLHSDQRKYLCDLCGKSFPQRSNLMAHYRYHRNLRNFICDVCSFGFVTRSDLERHKRIHTGEKPYLCQICPKAFSRLKYLNDHLNIHNGVTPYVCQTCSKGFADCSGYHKHIKRCMKKEKVDSVSPPTLTEDVSDNTETDSNVLTSEDPPGVTAEFTTEAVPPALEPPSFIAEPSTSDIPAVQLSFGPSETPPSDQILATMQPTSAENIKFLTGVQTINDDDMEGEIDTDLLLPSTSQQPLAGAIPLPPLQKPGTVTVVRVNGSDHSQAVNLIRQSLGTIPVSLGEDQPVSSNVSPIPTQFTWDLTHQTFSSHYIYHHGHS